MDGIQVLITSLESKLRTVFTRLQNGQITPSQWYTLSARLIARYSLTALMVGLGRQKLTEDELLVSWELTNNQFEYLDAFKAQIQESGEFLPGWESRAASYAKAIKVPYWKGRTQMLPLPAMPAQGTQCMNNCGCKWDVRVINAEAGDFDAYWERHKNDSCQTCIQREKEWNPLQIRGGVLVNPFVKEYIAKTLKHLAGQHNQKRHSWRYGANISLSKLKRQRAGDGKSEWDEYKTRARNRRGSKPDGKRPEKKTIPSQPKKRGDIVAEKIRAIGTKGSLKKAEERQNKALDELNEATRRVNVLAKVYGSSGRSGDFEKLQAAKAERAKRQSAYVAANKAYTKERGAIHAEYAEALKVDDPTQINHIYDGIGKNRQAGFDQTTQAVANMISQNVMPPGTTVVINGKNGTRANYQNLGGNNGRVNIKVAGNRTLAHELGHHVEYKSPGMLTKTKAFLDRRTQGEGWKSMQSLFPEYGYASNEQVKIDKFLSAYMGKFYPDATEIISMGIEYLLSEPLTLLEKDPEYFYFMIDILQGQ